ncbi:MAG: discoidin domain-containing protein [Planctomycetes bacterium]|nr:discoidin domain-containing protein [Planctomycetota bacterium]
MSAKRVAMLSLCLVLVFGCYAKTTWAANILYIANLRDQGFVEKDKILQDFMAGLGHTLVLFDDQQSEADTEAAALMPDIDLIYISETVGSGGIKNEITELDVPMIIGEGWAWDEMGLSAGSAGCIDVVNTNITIVNPEHRLAAGLTGTVAVLTDVSKDGAIARFSRTHAGGDGTVIATWTDGTTVFDVVMVYEKGDMLAKPPADGSGIIAKNIRIGIGFDERSFELWNENAFLLLEAAINYIVGDREAAVAVNPADGATDIGRQSMLQWLPGESAETHDVYFGMDFSDVNEASRTDTRAVLQAQAQEPNAFDPGLLAFGTTYYWRVDEVGAAPDNAVSKGTVWSFTAEPFSVAVTSIMASASSQQSDDLSPEKTINGSGLDEANLHGTAGETMWLSATGDQAVWIQYAFDRAYKLDKMLVWNSNQAVESFIGLGAKEVTLEVSTNGTDWTVLENVSQFAQAPGAAGYAANTTVDFKGFVAQFVRISVNSGYGPLGQFGLSEVRFFYIPTFATRPNPETGAIDVAPDVTLSWGRDGREAGSHDVYLGSTPDDLTLAGTVMESGFDTAALDLTLGETYSWRVDEVNEAMDPSTWMGDVWSFSTVDAIGVDDMERYADAEFIEIWATWVDGFGDPTNGSEVGANPAIGDFSPGTGIVHGGSQSLPIHYDNSAAAQSEAKRTFDAPMDWTGHGVQALVLFFQGSDTNTGGSLYVKINDTKVAYDGDPAALMAGGWNEWTISLADVAADLSRVTSLTLGVDGGGTGVVYVDDIQLKAGAGQ